MLQHPPCRLFSGCRRRLRCAAAAVRKNGPHRSPFSLLPAPPSPPRYLAPSASWPTGMTDSGPQDRIQPPPPRIFGFEQQNGGGASSSSKATAAILRLARADLAEGVPACGSGRPVPACGGRAGSGWLRLAGAWRLAGPTATSPSQPAAIVATASRHGLRSLERRPSSSGALQRPPSASYLVLAALG